MFLMLSSIIRKQIGLKIIDLSYLVYKPPF